MFEEVLPRPALVFVQGSIKDRLEVGRGIRVDGQHGGNLGHGDSQGERIVSQCEWRAVGGNNKVTVL